MENRKYHLWKFYPKYIYEKVEDMPYLDIKKDNIKLILLDMDNTLIDSRGNYSKDLKKWVQEMYKNNIELCIVSNSGKEQKVKKIASELGIKKYFFGAFKPLTGAFKKVCDSFSNIKKDEILMVGDQLFTDVWGGNRFGLKTALVRRISNNEIFISKVKRPFERIILNHYYKKEENSNKCKI